MLEGDNMDDIKTKDMKPKTVKRVLNSSMD